MRPRRPALLLAPLALLTACAAKPQAPTAPASETPAMAPAQPSPATPGEREEVAPKDAESAAEELRAAESELERALAGRADRDTGTVQPHGVSEGAPQKSPGPTRGDPCVTICRALSSMARATTHLCELAGESDHRCEDARTRTRSASDKVQAACPSCATP